MYTIISKQTIFEKIKQAMKNELEEIVVLFPNIEEIIIKNMLWAIFSKEQPYKTSAKMKSHHEVFALLSYDIVELAKKELENAGEKEAQFFVPDVDMVFQKKDFTVYIDYEDCDVLIEETIKTPKAISQHYQGVIALTLPDSGIVFDSFYEGSIYEEKNDWIIHYLDTYDKWQRQTMESLYGYVWQTGGHGRWIQNDYNNCFIAQANIDIGDNGSVFIAMSNQKVMGNIDMY